LALWESVRGLREAAGIAVVRTTQYLEEADVPCGRVAAMDAGKLPVCDTPGHSTRDRTIACS